MSPTTMWFDIVNTVVCVWVDVTRWDVGCGVVVMHNRDPQHQNAIPKVRSRNRDVHHKNAHAGRQRASTATVMKRS